MSYLSSMGIAGALYLILQICVTVHILLHKEDVHSTIGWIGLVWLTPLVGTVIYVLLGINRIHRKALDLRNSGPALYKLSAREAQEAEKLFPPSFWQLIRLGHKVHPQLFARGNRITPLINGDNAYPEMCRLIAQAKKEVLLASYILNNDKAGQMFLAALKTAAQNGARVKMLVDGVGLNYSKPNIMAAARKIKGLETAVFLPSKSPINLPFVNLRNHRKILVVDGQKAVFGGMNIAHEDLLKSKPKRPVQDVTFLVEGPVVEQMARVFEEDWIFTGKKPFVPAAYPHSQKLPGNIPARIIPDGPDSDYGKLQLMLCGALNCAQQSVSIVTPYFLPEEDVLNALELASLRGVNVEIILPAKSNIFGMDWAMQANFARLLKRGIKIYRTPAPFDHSKLMVADNAWVFAGSANWDVRSLKLNFECNIECFSKTLAEQVLKIIHAKKAAAQPETFGTHANTPWLKQLRNRAFKLLTPYY